MSSETYNKLHIQYHKVGVARFPNVAFLQVWPPPPTRRTALGWARASEVGAWLEVAARHGAGVAEFIAPRNCCLSRRLAVLRVQLR
jgi:hypothetical protein